MSASDNSISMLGCDITMQDKLSPFYLYSSWFIVPKKALYQLDNVSLPSAVSQAWKRMNTNINLLSVHPRFIQICPLCSPLIPSCLLPFTFFSLSPVIHVYIPRPDIEKSWLAWSLDKGGVLLGGVLLLRYGEGQEVLCIWVVKQNNKPSSCQVKWSRISRLSIRSPNKCTLSTPTHYIEWT